MVLLWLLARLSCGRRRESGMAWRCMERVCKFVPCGSGRPKPETRCAKVPRIVEERLDPIYLRDAYRVTSQRALENVG